MTQHAETPGLRHARDLTRHAAQWLQLIRFTSRPGAPTFSISVCQYHAMFDLEALDADRLAACRAMERAVQGRMLAQEFAAEAAQVCNMPMDPYHLHWADHARRWALWAIANLLRDAVQVFEAVPITE